MAIDAASKRRSAPGTRRLPWFHRFLPAPDGSVGVADRFQVAWVYVGLGAAAIVSGPYRVEAQQPFLAGDTDAQSWGTGGVAQQEFVAGVVDGRTWLAGVIAGQPFISGTMDGQAEEN